MEGQTQSPKRAKKRRPWSAGPGALAGGTIWSRVHLWSAGGGTCPAGHSLFTLAQTPYSQMNRFFTRLLDGPQLGALAGLGRSRP